MNISILTVFPKLYDPFLATSLVARAQENAGISYSVADFFSYCPPKQRIDAPTVGHGAGMLLRPEVVEKAIEDKEQKFGRAYRIFFSPHGKKLDQNLLQKIATNAQKYNHLMVIAGRYEGMDARVEQHYADEIVSIGDFVLLGGDMPAMILLEGVLRLLPGVVGKAESVEYESFKGPFVDYPSYALPVVWKDRVIPDVLRSGNHAAIAQWREQEAIKRTVFGHFNWLRSYPLKEDQKEKAYKIIPKHYIVLMHTDVMLPDGKVGTTSVTSMDIHDIARSSRTYGIKNYFIVTPLVDQQNVVKTLLDFWQTGVGIDYNPQRHEAVSLVKLMSNLEQVLTFIEQQEGQKPVLVSTSARALGHQQTITFSDQARVWESRRPVLFILGTGKGLSPDIVKACDFLLEPVNGFTDFNHLSVRSAAAVILDRWLGLQHKEN